MSQRVIQNRVFRVTLPPFSANVPSERIESVVVDAMESFIQTLGCINGERSQQIVAWREVFERVAVSVALGTDGAA